MKKAAFTLVEILLVLVILAILAIATFAIINPNRRIEDANDVKRHEDVQAILNATTLFMLDNQGNPPTYNGGNVLPLVTAANVMTAGAPASQLDGLSPVYLSSIPIDPGTDTSYQIGRSADNSIIVGTQLNLGGIFTVSE